MSHKGNRMKGNELTEAFERSDSRRRVDDQFQEHVVCFEDADAQLRVDVVPALDKRTQLNRHKTLSLKIPNIKFDIGYSTLSYTT